MENQVEPCREDRLTRPANPKETGGKGVARVIGPLKRGFRFEAVMMAKPRLRPHFRPHPAAGIAPTCNKHGFDGDLRPGDVDGTKKELSDYPQVFNIQSAPDGWIGVFAI